MGREIRRVPADWKHPTYRDVGKEHEYKISNGQYRSWADKPHPMFDRMFKDEMEEWYKEWKLWEEGKHPDQVRRSDFFVDWENERKDAGKPCGYVDWNGGPPDPAYYRHRYWAAEEATHYQMYETVSEGTPVSPVFASLKELEDWLVEDGNWEPCGWPQGPMTREAAQAFCGTGFAVSMVIKGGQMYKGAETALAMKGDGE